MLLGVTALILSATLFMFYLQAVCEKILRRQCGWNFLLGAANVNWLGFPLVRKALEELDVPGDYPRVRMRLMSDFLALTYLLKSYRQRRRFSYEERLLMMYFRAVFAALVLVHAFGLNERAVVLKLASILEYFANVLGERWAWTRGWGISNLSSLAIYAA